MANDFAKHENAGNYDDASALVQLADGKLVTIGECDMGGVSSTSASWRA